MRLPRPLSVCLFTFLVLQYCVESTSDAFSGGRLRPAAGRRTSLLGSPDADKVDAPGGQTGSEESPPSSSPGGASEASPPSSSSSAASGDSKAEAEKIKKIREQIAEKKRLAAAGIFPADSPPGIFSRPPPLSEEAKKEFEENARKKFFEKAREDMEENAQNLERVLEKADAEHHEILKTHTKKMLEIADKLSQARQDDLDTRKAELEKRKQAGQIKIVGNQEPYMEYEKSLATSLKNLAHSADENFIESEKRLHAWRAARLNAYHEQGELFGVKEEDKEGVKGGFEAKREERKNARKAAQEARPKSQQLTPFEDAE